MTDKYIARVLPREAALKLQRAAQTPNTKNDPLARQKAIERATEWVRRNYPDYFRAE